MGPPTLPVIVPAASPSGSRQGRSPTKTPSVERASSRPSLRSAEDTGVYATTMFPSPPPGPHCSPLDFPYRDVVAWLESPPSGYRVSMGQLTLPELDLGETTGVSSSACATATQTTMSESVGLASSDQWGLVGSDHWPRSATTPHVLVVSSAPRPGEPLRLPTLVIPSAATKVTRDMKPLGQRDKSPTTRTPTNPPPSPRYRMEPTWIAASATPSPWAYFGQRRGEAPQTLDGSEPHFCDFVQKAPMHVPTDRRLSKERTLEGVSTSGRDLTDQQRGDVDKELDTVIGTRLKTPGKPHGPAPTKAVVRKSVVDTRPRRSTGDMRDAHLKRGSLPRADIGRELSPSMLTEGQGILFPDDGTAPGSEDDGDNRLQWQGEIDSPPELEQETAEPPTEKAGEGAREAGGKEEGAVQGLLTGTAATAKDEKRGSARREDADSERLPTAGEGAEDEMHAEAREGLGPSDISEEETFRVARTKRRRKEKRPMRTQDDETKEEEKEPEESASFVFEREPRSSSLSEKDSGEFEIVARAPADNLPPALPEVRTLPPPPAIKDQRVRKRIASTAAKRKAAQPAMEPSPSTQFDIGSPPAEEAEVQAKPQRKSVHIAQWAKGRLALSQQSCRFELPMDMRKFETMSPIEYIRDYTVISSRRKILYQRVFLRNKDKSGHLPFKELERSVKEVLVNTLTSEQWVEIKDLLHLDEDMTIDSRLFHCICAVAERVLYPKHITEDTVDMPDFKREMLETADFFALNWKMEGIRCVETTRTLLDVLEA